MRTAKIGGGKNIGQHERNGLRGMEDLLVPFNVVPLAVKSVRRAWRTVLRLDPDGLYSAGLSRHSRGGKEGAVR